MPRAFLSQRVLEMEPSATMAMNDRAKQLKAEGKDIISLSVGEPDFKTPQHVCDAAKKAIDDGMHGYTPVSGIPELKKAIAKSLTRSTGVEYQTNQVVASPGGKYSIYLTLMSLVNPGDEVVIPAPYWVSYPEMVRLVGGTPVIVETKEENLFVLTPKALKKAISPKTKLLILNSPSNPSGQIIPSEAIVEIGRIMERERIWCLSDEIYNQLIFGDAGHKSIASVSDYCREYTVVADGCSKTYAMTGWRLGYIGAHPEVAKAIDDLQGQTCSNPCSIAQAAAVAALDGPQESVGIMRARFEQRGKLITKLLSDIPGFKVNEPRGAFYSLPNISGLFGKTVCGRVIESGVDFTNLALEKAHVAMVPGLPFGVPEHIRLSFATSEENIEIACQRLKDLVVGKIQ